MPGRFHHDYDYGYGHGFFWGLLFIIGIAVLAALVVYLIVRRPRSGAGVAAGPIRPMGVDPAVEAARVRYAQGQLTREAYLQVVGDLTGQPVVDATAPASASPEPPTTTPTPEV